MEMLPYTSELKGRGYERKQVVIDDIMFIEDLSSDSNARPSTSSSGPSAAEPQQKQRGRKRKTDDADPKKTKRRQQKRESAQKRRAMAKDDEKKLIAKVKRQKLRQKIRKENIRKLLANISYFKSVMAMHALGCIVRPKTTLTSQAASSQDSSWQSETNPFHESADLEGSSSLNLPPGVENPINQNHPIIAQNTANFPCVIHEAGGVTVPSANSVKPGNSFPQLSAGDVSALALLTEACPNPPPPYNDVAKPDAPLISTMTASVAVGSLTIPQTRNVPTTPAVPEAFLAMMAAPRMIPTTVPETVDIQDFDQDHTTTEVITVSDDEEADGKEMLTLLNMFMGSPFNNFDMFDTADEDNWCRTTVRSPESFQAFDVESDVNT